jgi:hypothetical protein
MILVVPIKTWYILQIYRQGAVQAPYVSSVLVTRSD